MSWGCPSSLPQWPGRVANSWGRWMACAPQSCLPSRALYPGLPSPGTADIAHRLPISPPSPLTNTTDQPLLSPTGLRHPLSTASQEAPASQNSLPAWQPGLSWPQPLLPPFLERPPREPVPEHSERAHGLWGQTDRSRFLHTYSVTLDKTNHLSEPPIN